jgi:hypothetical protein
MLPGIHMKLVHSHESEISQCRLGRLILRVMKKPNSFDCRADPLRGRTTMALMIDASGGPGLGDHRHSRCSDAVSSIFLPCSHPHRLPAPRLNSLSVQPMSPSGSSAVTGRSPRSSEIPGGAR